MAKMDRCIKILNGSYQVRTNKMSVFYPVCHQLRFMSQISGKSMYNFNRTMEPGYSYSSRSLCGNHSSENTDAFKKNWAFYRHYRRSNWYSGKREHSRNKSDGRRHLIMGGFVLGGITLLSSTLLAKEKEETSPSISDDNEEKNEKGPEENTSLKKTIELSRDLVQRIKDETGSPGLVVAVSVDGKTVWTEGLGYGDVENRTPCKPETVLRIASISKPITMAAVARLWEKGDLDIDKPIQHYVPEFPEKTWKGNKVTLTTRQLLSHLGGIRHYDKDYMKKQDDQTEDKKSKSMNQSKSSPTKTDQSEDSKKKNEMELSEYYIKDRYDSVIDSLNLFKEDPLIHKPGSEFCYTTHGWTLISAVVERAAKVKFEKYLQTMLDELGMSSTFLEEQDRLIYNRGRHYVKNKRGRLVNAPYTDLSYKWAGGGLISSVLDLNKFGNAMLYSYQVNSNQSTNLPGFLKPETMQKLWTKVDGTKLVYGGIGEISYGLGWEVLDSEQMYGCCRDNQCFVSHTGGAVGGSSVLLILPSQTEEYTIEQHTNEEYSGKAGRSDRPPRGVVVSIIVNMTSVGLIKTAFDIAKAFDSVRRVDFSDS